MIFLMSLITLPHLPLLRMTVAQDSSETPTEGMGVTTPRPLVSVPAQPSKYISILYMCPLASIQ